MQFNGQVTGVKVGHELIATAGGLGESRNGTYWPRCMSEVTLRVSRDSPRRNRVLILTRYVARPGALNSQRPIGSPCGSARILRFRGGLELYCAIIPGPSATPDEPSHCNKDEKIPMKGIKSERWTHIYSVVDSQNIMTRPGGILGPMCPTGWRRGELQGTRRGR